MSSDAKRVFLYKYAISIHHNGADVTQSLPINSVVINDFAAEQADTASISIAGNPDSVATGDEIEIKANGELLGKFVINKIKINYKQSLSLECASVDIQRAKQVKNRTHEKIKLSELAEKLARENDFKVVNNATIDPLKNFEQHGKSDLHFLHDEVERAGLSLSVKNQTLIITEPTKAQERHRERVEEGEIISLEYEKIRGTAANSVEVHYFDTAANENAIARVGDSEPVQVINSFVSDKAAALELAKSKQIKQKNASQKGVVKINGRVMNAGSLLDIQLADETLKAQINKITHRIGADGWFSDIEFC